MAKVAHTSSVEFRIGAQGRGVLPAPVRRAAHVDEGDRLVARAEGPGRIVLETPAAIRARVWAAAPTFQNLDAAADVRSMRDEDNAVSDANFARRLQAPDVDSAEAVGERLLTELGL